MLDPSASTCGLNTSQLEQNLPDGEIYVEDIKSSYCGGKDSIVWLLSKISCEIPQLLVAQNIAKLSCCGQ